MDTTDALEGWLGALHLGQAQQHGGLMLFGVHVAQPWANDLAYTTLAEALQSEAALISEKPQAIVRTLLLINTGDLPILVLDGEEVVGGRQNRVVNTTLLVPAHTSFDLDVTCVEHGRWFENSAIFAPGEAVYPTLRGQKIEQVSAALAATAAPRVDQMRVWDEIAARHRRTGAVAPTGALHDAYLERDDALNETTANLRVPDGAVGVVAVIGGRARCADVFDRPRTLDHFWARLVRSYALEADGAPPATPVAGKQSAARLLSRARRATRRTFPSKGLGEDVRLSGSGIAGAALVHAGVVAHTALFRQANAPGEGSIRRPAERARRIGP